MSASANRSGAPIQPVVVTPGGDGPLSSGRVVEFRDAGGKPIGVRPCLVTLMKPASAITPGFWIEVNPPWTTTWGGVISERTNGGTLVLVPFNSFTYDASEGGKIEVQRLAIWTDDGSNGVGLIEIHGWAK